MPNLEFVAGTLQNIDLVGNQLVDVMAFYENTYPHLECVSLRGNSLREFCLPPLAFVPRLQCLHLVSNNLTTIHLPNGFDGLILTLRDNPWLCGQSLSWVRQCSSKSSYLECRQGYHMDNWNCHSPATVRGMSPLEVGKNPQNTRWHHQMEIFSALLVPCAGNSPVNSPYKGQWRGALVFSSTWTNGWENNRDAGDLRRHRSHYDVTVVIKVHSTENREFSWC